MQACDWYVARPRVALFRQAHSKYRNKIRDSTATSLEKPRMHVKRRRESKRRRQPVFKILYPSYGTNTLQPPLCELATVTRYFWQITETTSRVCVRMHVITIDFGGEFRLGTENVSFYVTRTISFHSTIHSHGFACSHLLTQETPPALFLSGNGSFKPTTLLPAPHASARPPLPTWHNELLQPRQNLEMTISHLSSKRQSSLLHLFELWRRENALFRLQYAIAFLSPEAPLQ